MIEVVEAALLNNLSARETAQRLLQFSAAPLRKAVDYQSQSDDLFTITIFKAETGEDGKERMVPIAREWTDSAASAGGRAWAKGKGYTGVLWQLASSNSQASVIEPDTETAGIRERYPVDHYDADKEATYRSVASYPITIGANDQVWGCVTATSSRAGVFDHAGELPVL